MPHIKSIQYQFLPCLLALTILLSFTACSSSSTSTTNTSSSVNASEIPLSETHPFVYADITWDATPTEVEASIGKAADSVSFAGGGKKTYRFENVICNDISGKCIFNFKEDFLYKSTYEYSSTQPFVDVSNKFIESLKETYGEPSNDKSTSPEDGSDIWLEWTTDDISVSYFYCLNPDENKYMLVMGYELPESKIPVTNISDRNGDFRIGFWGDDMDTINKYESATFEGISSDGTTMIFSGTVAGNNTYIFYIFDEEGKLYKGAYQLTDSYNEGSMYISIFNTLKDGLTEKYGTPTIDKKNKLSSLANYTDDGTALQLGYVVYATKWNTDTTDVSLGMLSVNYEISILMDYVDPTHAEVKNTTGL